MEIAAIILTLESQVGAIAGLVQGVSEEQARWKPDAASWSLLEVLSHLADEEREDFRALLAQAIADPERDLPPIESEGWAMARAYQERDWHAQCQDFVEERQRSLQWLRALENPDLERTVDHPSGFQLRAGDLLAAWAAHDLLHMRQIIELRWAYHQQQAAPYDVRYAGEW